MGTETGDAPPFLLQKAWETGSDLRTDGARWVRYWLSRRRLFDELGEDGGTEPESDWLDDS